MSLALSSTDTGTTNDRTGLETHVPSNIWRYTYCSVVVSSFGDPVLSFTNSISASKPDHPCVHPTDFADSIEKLTHGRMGVDTDITEPLHDEKENL